MKTKFNSEVGLPTGSSGFTLVEIIVVVVLIGLLSAIALPNFLRSRSTAQTNVCINNLRVIGNAIQQWALEERKDPNATVQFSDISGYLKHTTLCPAGGTTFADSYSISLVSEQPVCQKVPSSHSLPGAEVALSNPTPGGSAGAPTSPTGGGGADGGGATGGNGGNGQGHGPGGSGGKKGGKP